MMFINVYMIEPATASLAVYLLTKTNRINPYVLKRRPFHYKKNYVNGFIKINIQL
jgi:hypothetical protein